MGCCVKDLVELVIYSMLFEEEKLNKLLLIGKSNKGKTALMKLLAFVEMSAKDFVKIVSRGAKWSKSESDNLMSSGLLLADDISHDLPLDIKNITDKINLDVMYMGPIEHPCKFLVMTSTHDSVATTVNDELKNRVLCMKIKGGFTFNDSKLRSNDPLRYREHTERYIKQLVLKTLQEEATPDALRKLQKKYALPDHNERDEILEDIEIKLMDTLRPDSGFLILDIYKHKGDIYIKRRNSIRKKIFELVQDGFEGHRVDVTKEVTLLIDKYVSKKRDTIWVNKKPESYYKILVKKKKK